MKVVNIAAEAILDGKVVACPTDTIYGLLADATNGKAVRKIFLIKGREKKKPLPIFVSSIAMARSLAEISPYQERFLKKSWPGKITVVLESRGLLPKETGTKKKIGIRIPKHRLIRQIMRTTRKPLTGTSANVSGKPACRSVKEIKAQFEKSKYKPDYIIDGGKLAFSRPSIVVDITGKTKKWIRR